ncbi:hypothetical protein [Janthinobacterium sp. CG_S6]|uniref:hypothetical protein n=1 Tax=Janthinobacterium sp. CG_S6 TaxID=3071707 RepID=UPI002DFA9DCF|nr:DUF971 family protein [Janthinobacterium sp. CG_S6]
MLTLNDSQWADLTVRDTNSFVAAVCDQYLSTRPEQVAAPGRDAVLMQMNRAHDYAIQIGFSETPHIIRWMYLAADAPGIDGDKMIAAYLRKAGATPEQRLDDMLAVVMNELKELEGND